MNIDRVDAHDHALAIQWLDGSTSSYPYLFLRDNDPAGFHPQTGERQFDLLSVPEDLKPVSVILEGDGISITWTGAETTVSRIPVTWLEAHRPGQRAADAADVKAETWDGRFAAHIPRIAAKDLGSSNVLFLQWLLDTKRYGLSVVHGIDDDENAGVTLGERIGFLRRTNFGLTFRVETIPDPNNLAYTSHALPLHTDLPNQEMPPGYQFLHCVKNGA